MDSIGPAGDNPTVPLQVRVSANDFARQWAEVRDDCLAAVDRVGRSGWLVLGAEVERFEQEVADWWGLPFAVGVASGLDAIELALRAAGVHAGDRVLTTPLSAFATTLAIWRVGAIPVWSDVDDSGGLDLELAHRVLTDDPGIAAMVPVHLYGHPLDPQRLSELAEAHDLILIEDCAQSAGARRNGAPTGGAGVAAATSFYPTKNLGAMGDGGLVLTADEELAGRIRQLRNYGQRQRYEHVVLGINSRLDELQAAILRSGQLPRLDRWLRRRTQVAEAYDRAFDGTGLRPIAPGGGRSARHLYPVEVMSGRAEEVADALTLRGVAAGRHYPFLAPDAPAATGLGETIGELAVARRLATTEVSLPLHPHLSDDEVQHVVASCREVSA